MMDALTEALKLTAILASFFAVSGFLGVLLLTDRKGGRHEK